MYRKLKSIITALVVAGVLAGCAQKTVKTEDFLSDYANLEKVNDDFSFFKAPDFTTENYPRAILEPIQFALDPEASKDFTEEEKREIREYGQQRVNKILSAHFQMVTQPGPGVCRVRLAFTDIEKSNSLLALYPMTRASGVGRGGAAIEGEIVDSETGTQLAAFTRRGEGSALHGSGVGSLSDIKTAIDTWAEQAAKNVAKLVGAES